MCNCVKKMCYLPSFFCIIHHWQHIYIYIFDIVIVKMYLTQISRPGRIAAVLCYLMFIGDFFLGIAQFESSEPQRVFSIFTGGCLLNSGGKSTFGT